MIGAGEATNLCCAHRAHVQASMPAALHRMNPRNTHSNETTPL
jgi:hypothetical protein